MIEWSLGMAENETLLAKLQELDTLLKESAQSGLRVKQLLLLLLQEKLPNLPVIEAYNPDGYNIFTKDIEALVIEQGGLGKKFSFYQQEPDRETSTVMTTEGIFRVPVRSARISTNMFMLVADLDVISEIPLMEYPCVASEAVESMNRASLQSTSTA